VSFNIEKNTEADPKGPAVYNHADYDAAEIANLKEALNRTHMERLLFATKLYKVQQTLKKATYTHKQFKSAYHKS
jgi:hypothetical protein